MDPGFESSVPQPPRGRGKKKLSAVNRSYPLDTSDCTFPSDAFPLWPPALAPASDSGPFPVQHPPTGGYRRKMRCSNLKFDLHGTLLDRSIPSGGEGPGDVAAGVWEFIDQREYRSASMTLINRIFAALVVLMGLGLLLGGIYLATLAVLTIPWALWESGTFYWALFPRLLVPLALASLGLLLSPSVLPDASRGTMRGLGVLAVLGTIVFFALAFVPHGVVSPIPNSPYTRAAANMTPSDWSGYGRTTAGTRYAPFTQINRDNVKDLKLAWTYHTGEKTSLEKSAVDQNTPSQIGDTVFTCTPDDRIAALDADSGAERWKFDSHSSSPFWNRCRGLGYYKLKEAPADGVCAERIVNSTIDTRLLELDAKTGKPCADFGNGGIVDLKQGIGEVKPGFYFQSSAPLVARDYIIIGGWVVDNYSRGEPSGVIRAFDARTGALVWAWDLGNPEITGQPPEGQTYTRGTPNMWTTAAYDDQLGLIYAPLGNATPDFFGMGRPPHSDEYNSSLVALDVVTGQVKWKFQTVHHDIWDYDLPSQPALVDVPDGKGGTIPGVLQTTKRGQLFLLDRATGKPLADVAERPVPMTGAVPEEKLSSTQPFSVGMPTIGAERLTEKKMWGATMFDQLMCRILFKQLRYDGDFTPIGLTKALDQPGNIGGFNWGSTSYDPVNHLAYMNDIRVPNVFWLMQREEFDVWSKSHKLEASGHGPSPQLGTPYGQAIYIWTSPIGVPCNQPPYGTITAVDLNTHKVAWQVPAGTTERLGPFGIASHLPMPAGMPTYAGTMTTAGGLVFFAGFQDYYMRAYDAQNGKLVWQYALPVGSSATPISYVSPATGKQYIVISVGGAAHSPDNGDYVMAFSLPDTQK
jgi:quinate dehydrogenase (quinone)